jgi:hypothetical protein
VDHITCNKCSYEKRFQPSSYDYVLEDGARLYVIVCRAWCSSCGDVVEAEHLHTLETIDRELRAIDSCAHMFDPKSVAEVREQFLLRRGIALRRKSPPRCLCCGSTEIYAPEPYQPIIHPGCGGELRLVESTRDMNAETLLCDIEGRHIEVDPDVV